MTNPTNTEAELDGKLWSLLTRFKAEVTRPERPFGQIRASYIKEAMQLYEAHTAKAVEEAGVDIAARAYTLGYGHHTEIVNLKGTGDMKKDIKAFRAIDFRQMEERLNLFKKLSQENTSE